MKTQAPPVTLADEALAQSQRSEVLRADRSERQERDHQPVAELRGPPQPPSMDGELGFLHQGEAGLEKPLRGDDPIEAIAG
jgi:hypothetical protein